MPGSSAPSFKAAEDIGPSLFVRVSGNREVSLCDAGDLAIGVSQEGTREAPIPGVTTPLAAAQGEPIHVYTMSEPCEVVAGGSIDAGDYLKPNADAQAVVASEGDTYSAVALSDASSGEKVKVQVQGGVTPPDQNT